MFAGNKGLMVQSVDGQEAFQLTSDPKDISPAWSQYGNYIAFLTDRSGQWEIWVANSDGSNSRPLLDTELEGLTLDYASAGERAIDWSW